MGHVRDRWMTPGPNGRKVRNDRWGRGQRWQARWVERGRERVKAFSTKDAAELHLARVESGMAPSRAAPSMTVAEYQPVWLSHQLHYAPGTVTTVKNRMRAQILPALGDLDLVAVTRSEVQEAVVLWSQTMAPATVHQMFSFVTTMFDAAVEDGLVPSTPCARINLPVLRKARVVPLTVEQVTQVADQVPPWFRSMVVFGAATGLRGGELRGLTVDRLLGDDVRVDRQLVGVSNRRPVWGPTKSKAGERRLAMGKVAREAVERHLEEYGEGVDGLVWVTREKGPLTRRRGAYVWQVGIAGMALKPRSGWHELRHHHASLLIAAGLSPRAVADRLGHDDPAETLRTYAHLWPDDEERTVAAIDSALIGLLDRL